jgi:hypothetical protein
MFEAEFTHEGDRCSFETLLSRLKLTDPTLQAIAEIVRATRELRWTAELATFGRVLTGKSHRLIAR